MKKIAFALAAAAFLGVAPVGEASEHPHYNYYITEEQQEEANARAKEIADYVLSQKQLTTDFQKVQLATKILSRIACKSTYELDDPEEKFTTPYGLLVLGRFSCAGTASTLGLVLEYMGYTEYEHTNYDEWLHQWIYLDMDGRRGYADPARLPDGDVGFGVYEWGERVVKEALEKRGEAK